MTSEDIFSPFGVLRKKLASFSYREGQEAMAGRVEKAFKENRGCIIEAGTGIGKSFAYLVPSLLLIRENVDVKIVIATSTITLQKQLYEKDLPFLTKLLGVEDKSSILYGRNNYICKTKLDSYISAIGILTLDPDSIEGRVVKWVETTKTGSRIDVSDRNLSGALSSLLCDDKTCLGRHCSHFGDCFMYSARRKAQQSRIVVTNHHLVLVDAQLRWENKEDFSSPVILPGYTHLVLDEAHHIETEATSLFSDKVSLEALNTELDSLSFKRGELGNKSLIEYLALVDSSKNRFFTSSFDSVQKKIRSDIRVYFTLLKGIFSRCGGEKSILLDENFYSLNRNNLSNGEVLCDEIKNIAFDIKEYIKSDDEKFTSFIDRLYKIADSLYYLSDTLRTFIRFNEFSSLISYTNLLDDGEWEIVISPLQTGPIIKERLLDNLSSYLFSSATLSIGGNFSYFKSRMGLEGVTNIEEGIYFSPFNYEKNLMYLIPQDGRSFVNRDPEYISYASSLIAKAILSSSGGALVLFTSFDMMRKVYKIVNDDIGEKTELLIQDNRISRTHLLAQFKNNKDSSLFATSSFWEGIDAPGDTLRLLVITKLPFDVPSDPVNKARSDYINKTSEKGSFLSLTLPNAMIKMKQGVGRVIRKEDDRGVVLILDGRITKKFYSHLLFASIPPGYFPEDTMCENISDKIESFLF